MQRNGTVIARQTLWLETKISLWKFFTSVKLAIVLISLIVLFGLVGTLIPQEKFTREVDYISKYGLKGYQIIKTLQLNNVFHSWYFKFLVLLFVLNLMACTYKRLQASLNYYKTPMVRKSPQAMADMKLNACFEFEGVNADAWKERALKALRAKRYRVKDLGDQLLAEKWRWERFGIDVFHVSLLIFIFGLILTNTLGFETIHIAHKGEVFKAPGADFYVRVDKFWSENYRGSEKISDWKTQLTILENNKEVRTAVIEVNQPFTYRGISFYQAAFGNDWQGAADLTIKAERADGKELGEFGAKVKDGFSIPNEKLFVRVGAFLPDFALTEDGRAYSRTQRLNNPAAYLEVYDDKGTPLFRTWTFAFYPSLQHVVKESPYRFYLMGYKAPEFTGLEISYDPGIPIVYSAFALMILMLLVHLYFKHRQIWVHIDATNRRVLLGAKARKYHSTGFENEFRGIIKRITETRVSKFSSSQVDRSRI